MKIVYSENNSGGRWWLTKENYLALEKEGWAVRWSDKKDWPSRIAFDATKEFPSEGEAIAEWERVTGQDAYDMGCPCCGQPHNFYNE